MKVLVLSLSGVICRENATEAIDFETPDPTLKESNEMKSHVHDQDMDQGVRTTISD